MERFGSKISKPSAFKLAFSVLEASGRSTLSFPSATTLQPSSIVSWKGTGIIFIFLFFSQVTMFGSVQSKQTAASFSANITTIKSI